MLVFPRPASNEGPEAADKEGEWRVSSEPSPSSFAGIVLGDGRRRGEDDTATQIIGRSTIEVRHLSLLATFARIVVYTRVSSLHPLPPLTRNGTILKVDYAACI